MKPEDLRDVPVDVRLAGVSAEELRSLSPENRARLRALLLADDE